MNEREKGIFEYITLARGLPDNETNRTAAKDISAALELAEGIEHPATTVEEFLRAKGFQLSDEIRREARTISRFANKYLNNERFA